MPHVHHQRPRGALAILTLLGVTVFALAVISTLATLATSESQMSSAEQTSAQTFYAAESGLNKAIYSLVSDDTPRTIAYTDYPVPGVSVNVKVEGNGFQRIVTATAQDPTGKVRTSQFTVKASSFAGGFVYGAQTDVGGVTISASDSTIHGDVYSNGDVTGSGIIKGNATVAGADQKDVYQVNPTDEFAFGTHVASAFYTDAAQAFTVSSTCPSPCTLNQISLLLRKVGAPTKTLFWDITVDNGGKPNNSALAGGFGSINPSTLSSSLTWVNINVPSPVAVTAGSKYWIVLDATLDDIDDVNNRLAWGKDSTDGYSGGSGYSTKSWTNSLAVWAPTEADGADLNFKAWLRTTTTSLKNVAVTANAAANTIQNSTITGNASYQIIQGSTVSGSSTVTVADPEVKSLPITASDITKWQTQVQTACGTGCISGSYSVSTNLNPSASTLSTAGDNLTPDTTYYYRIAAVAGGVETITSKEVSAHTPQNGHEKTIQLTWNKIGASTYRIYRATAAGVYGSQSLINGSGSCGATSCTFNDNGNVSFTTGTTSCPDTCLGSQKISGDLTVENNLSLTLTGNVWVTGDINVNQNAVVKMDSSLSSQSVVLLTNQKVDASNNVTFCGSGCVSNMLSPAVSNLGSLLPDTKYFYVVTAVVGGNEMGESAEVTATTTTNKQTITLNWDPVVGATSYRVYRTTNAGAYSSRVGSPATNSFTDSGTGTIESASPQTNFLLVVSSDIYTSVLCPYTSGTKPSIQAANNSNSVIFAAPFGELDVKKGSINAGASYSLCLEAQATVNFVSSIASLWVPSPTTSPITSVANSWSEQ